VLIIDKSTFPRKKLCAGLITFKTIKLLERVFGETVDALKRKNVINYESSRYEVFSNKVLIAQRGIEYPFTFVDRDDYDHFFLEKARHAGATVAEGDGIKNLYVLKNTVTTMSGRTFSADIIIGADGVNSRIRRNFPVDLFGVEDWSGNLAVAHEIFIDRTTLKKQYDSPALFFGDVACGYAWIFPNRDRVKIGMCALNKGNRKDILTVFKKFLSAKGIQDAQYGKVFSYVLPYGNFLPSPSFRNIMLVGDAAGFADPLFGEGIFYAQRSAELACQAIFKFKREGSKSHQSLGELYVQLLQKNIYQELIYAGKIRNTLFPYFSKFQYLPLKLLMTILGTMPIETVQGLRSYKWMRKKDEV
jgi:flavin-dependent dehydrogenase